MVVHRALLPGSRRSRNLTSLLRGEVGALTSSPASRRLPEARVRTGPFSLQPSFGTFAKARLLQAGGGQIEKEKGKGNDHPIETDTRDGYGALAWPHPPLAHTGERNTAVEERCHYSGRHERPRLGEDGRKFRHKDRKRRPSIRG